MVGIPVHWPLLPWIGKSSHKAISLPTYINFTNNALYLPFCQEGTCMQKQLCPQFPFLPQPQREHIQLLIFYIYFFYIYNHHVVTPVTITMPCINL